MISQQAIETIKQTVPVLKQHGEELTKLFYQNMFHNNPEVKVFFNQAHQHTGSQQRALAGAICAYAENIDNPVALASAVELIAQKHASLGIKPEHYPIVGQNLLASIKVLLGDAATDEIIAAWAEAYQALASIFINREQQIYDHHQQQFGWQGFKTFKVTRRVAESENTVSFYLESADLSVLPPHQAGQYITVRIPTEDGFTMRNYSLSNAPGTPYYRISVKREKALSEEQPNGHASSYLHDNVAVGDEIEIAPPCGEFVLEAATDDKPVVFIAGGIGITPLLSMLHATLEQQLSQRPVYFIQTVLNSRVHAFKGEIAQLATRYSNLHWHVRYSEPLEIDTLQSSYDSQGYVDHNLLENLLGRQQADYYLCGPKIMLQHICKLLKQRQVPDNHIHYEFFGPADSLAA